MSKKLRNWQQVHLNGAVQKARAHDADPIWLSQAVTGAGKTTFGVETALHLHDSGFCKRIIVLAPSVEIARGWKEKLDKHHGVNATVTDYDAEDVNALISTYQGAGNIYSGPDDLVILDEIHHAEREASWGIRASKISESAKFTLCLTGTPWMTKGRIAILDKFGYYKDKCIQADMEYSYKEDLRQNDQESRATVPVQCRFYDDIAKEKNKDGTKSNSREYRLEKVTDENRAQIIAAADKDIPLAPHVFIKDNELSNNPMARRMLGDAIVELDRMEESQIYQKNRVKPMGLVTCKSIAEATKVKEWLEEQDGVTVEAITSDDERASSRLAEIASGREKNPPQWIVSVGMVSEGVDIPAIKVVVYLNAITTVLFLIQFIGRALRRIQKENGKYVDAQLHDTGAMFFAPAHPMLVKVGTELQEIGNQALQEAKKSDGVDGDVADSKPAKEYEGENNGATTFHWGREINDPDLLRKLGAIQADGEAMDGLTSAWVTMIYAWLDHGNEEQAIKEVNSRLDQFDISWECAAEDYNQGMSYDSTRRLRKKEAERITSLLRFTHPEFRPLPDSEAFSEIRKFVCKDAFGEFKTINKMSNEHIAKYVSTAKRIYQRCAA